ncbi:MAG TPA: DUF1552 domain-containing protein [Bryobacteraceae bacterium]|nr:DUF1552 domain-containing protein [Bryobacteraceae bacterium]
MIIAKRALPRRTILRGIGTTLALPLLDAMVPALTAAAQTAAKPVRRLGVVYIPNGMVMQKWTPSSDGVGFEMPETLKPLEPFRSKMLVLSGLNNTPPPLDSGAGVHARASTRFLTAVPPKRSDTSAVEAAISIDQLAARMLGSETQLASLEVAIEGRDLAGSCDIGFSCAYTNTISWRGPTTPLPMENDPRAVFERLFGGSESTDRAARLARLQANRSILDSVSSRIGDFQRRIGSRDRAKLAEYLDAVRDIERRIQNAEQQSARELPVVEQPPGIPASFEAHARLMFDLQLLAYQTDLTRVITFMMGRELSGRTFPQIGVVESHHATSHHQNDPVKLANLQKIKAHHAELFAYYVEKLNATPDGDGSLLDHMMILFGAGMSDSNAHSGNNLPVTIVGGGSGSIRGGRHLKYPPGTPMGNLLLAMLDKLGVPGVERIGDSTRRLEHLSDI